MSDTQMDMLEYLDGLKQLLARNVELRGKFNLEDIEDKISSYDGLGMWRVEEGQR